MCQVMGVDLTEDEITMTRDAGCPEHYRGDGYITCSRAMKSALAMWPAAMALCSTIAVWWWCCAFKYVWRCMVKGKTLEDIDKAIDCLYKLRKEIKPYLKSQMEADHIVTGSQAAEQKRDITLEERM